MTVDRGRRLGMLKLFHAPRSRSSAILWLLEELGVPYDVELVDIHAEGGAPESYRAIHPHKKVPAIVHDDVTITERAAIAIHLCDAFPEAGLAPPIGDPRRGPYVSWLVYRDAVADPALTARLLGWEYLKNETSFGALEDVVQHVEATVWDTPYLTGREFTAADTQMASMLGFGIAMGAVSESPVLRAYLERTRSRPAYRRAADKDAALLG